jgi:glycerol-3-phosphate acyltransferase PlsY
MGWELSICGLLGYLLGSVNFAVIIARHHDVDILKAGSGNPGATNVKRVLGRGPGTLVFALDVMKGIWGTIIPLLLINWIGHGGLGTSLQAVCSGEHSTIVQILKEGTKPADFYLLMAGFIGTLLGHCFSIFLKFRGGKGVASTIGGLLVLLPTPILIGAILWALVFFLTRYVSLASLALGFSLPVSCWLLHRNQHEFILAAILAAFNVWTHRSNIGRLYRGEENRFSKN